MRFTLVLLALTLLALPTRAQERSAPPEVFEVVEEMPELEGGIEALMAQIQYPEEARREGVEGRVLVRFVVDKDGRPSNLEVLRSADERLDAAAVSAVQQARFRPGRQRGRAVNVRMVLPVVFVLSESDEE